MMPPPDLARPSCPGTPLELGVAYIDVDLRVAEADARFRAMVAAEPELIGRHVDGLLPTAPALGPLVGQVLASRLPLRDLLLSEPGANRRLMASLYPLISRVGLVLGVDLVLSGLVGAPAPGPIDDSDRPPGGELAVAPFVSDLTQLRQAVERAEQLQRLTMSLARAITPAGVAAVMTANGREALGASVCSLLVVEPDQATLRLIDSQGLDTQTTASWAVFPLTAATPISDAVRRSEPIWLRNRAERAASYPDLAEAYPAEGEKAWAALPLILGRDALGAIGLIFPSERAFDAEERTFLATVASLCAQALERARLMASEHEALAAAAEALALLNTMIDSAPLGMAFMDNEFRYRWVNAALAGLNGIAPAAHIGRRASDLFPQFGLFWEHYWRLVLETGEPLIDLELSTGGYQRARDDLDAAGPAQATDQYALVSYYPVRSAGGELLGVGVVVQDITERKRAEQMQARLLASAQEAREAEQAARARAEEAVRLRDTFLSIAAHELRNPLTSLLGQAQLLARRLNAAAPMSEQNQRSLSMVISQAKRLDRLITDILDGARLETGQLVIRRAPFDFGALLREAVENLPSALGNHRLSYTIADEPLIVDGDAMRLDQVVQNLLSNAVKYSPSGGSIEVRAARSADEVVLSVRDQGIGVPAEALPKLFERFYRAANADTQRISGAGVGLYVVNEIVAQHGGRVSVESQPGHGSTFTITLPIQG
jgi:signal transduction histidine kinase